MRKTLKAEKGFTFLEIVTIVIIIGIIGAIAVSMIISPDTYGTTGELDKVKGHLRYAQGRAIRTDSSWGVRFNTQNTYWLFQTTDTNQITFAGESQNQVALSKLLVTSAPLDITFDRFGSPGAADITVTTSGGNIIVTANTGFIQ